MRNSALLAGLASAELMGGTDAGLNRFVSLAAQAQTDYGASS